jgi:hypothetical protein
MWLLLPLCIPLCSDSSIREEDSCSSSLISLSSEIEDYIFDEEWPTFVVLTPRLDRLIPKPLAEIILSDMD